MFKGGSRAYNGMHQEAPEDAGAKGRLSDLQSDFRVWINTRVQ